MTTTTTTATDRPTTTSQAPPPQNAAVHRAHSIELDHQFCCLQHFLQQHVDGLRKEATQHAAQASKLQQELASVKQQQPHPSTSPSQAVEEEEDAVEEVDRPVRDDTHDNVHDNDAHDDDQDDEEKRLQIDRLLKRACDIENLLQVSARLQKKTQEL